MMRPASGSSTGRDAAIAQEVPGRGVPREIITQLLGGPLGGGMGRDAEVKNPAPVVRQHQEDIQDPEPDCRHREEIDRDHALEVILQERAPSLGRQLAPRTMYLPTLVSPISMPSLRSSPCTRGAPESGLSWLIRRIRPRIFFETAGLPGLPPVPSNPRQPEALAVPGDHRFRLDDDKGGAPISPSPG